MRKNRCKRIKYLMQNLDTGLYTSIHNAYGSRTKEMMPQQIYRCAKKLWKEHHPSTYLWGKIPVSIKQIAESIEKQRAESTVSKSVSSEGSDGINLSEQVS